VLVFGTAEDLLGLNLPLLDAVKDDTGRVVPHARQTRDELLLRIENEAVTLPLDKSPSAQRRANKKVEEAVAYTGPSFRFLLKELRGLVSPVDGSEFSFADDVGVPSILRLMSHTSQTEFKGACKHMINVGGLPEENVKSLFKWVEGIDGVGPELSKAVDALLYPDEDVEEEPTVEGVAKTYGVQTEDVIAVSKVYKRLQELGNG